MLGRAVGGRYRGASLEWILMLEVDSLEVAF
jgi:hypothetical protein